MINRQELSVARLFYVCILVVCNYLVSSIVTQISYLQMKIDQALTLMKECGIKLDVITFSTIMNAWSSAGVMDNCEETSNATLITSSQKATHVLDIVKAEAVLTSMSKYGVQPKVVTFNMINRWCGAGKMDHAVRKCMKWELPWI